MIGTAFSALASEKSLVVLAAAGFEERAPRGLSVLHEAGTRPRAVILLTYPGSEHRVSFRRMMDACEAMHVSPQSLIELPAGEHDALSAALDALNISDADAVCDITGMSRINMMVALSLLQEKAKRLSILYTEAEEYYPLARDVAPLVRGDRSDAFYRLSAYEHAEVMYSSTCVVDEIPGFPGRHLPNYPLMLVVFLPFKRSRVGAVLREYESAVRFLIKGRPAREDLAWRADALDAINFDLIEENRSEVIELSTLDWRETFNFLEQIYNDERYRYRFNKTIAPLGSKMQTVAAWKFARRHNDVKLISSTPTHHFVDKYSRGCRETFLLRDV